jgi:hypothetical protein
VPINFGNSAGALAVTSFHQFSAFAASRGEGLHPKLRALLERAAASPFSEVSIRSDGMIQAGPSPNSEVVSPRLNVTPLSRERGEDRHLAKSPAEGKQSIRSRGNGV